LSIQPRPRRGALSPGAAVPSGTALYASLPTSAAARPLRVAARATIAAPTYFPPCECDWAGRVCRFIDGGVWANNPSAVALSEAAAMTAARQMTATSVLLVSLGTGMAPSGATFNETATWIGAASDTIKVATSVAAGELLLVEALK
jgi:patatin-like phospholipase/acyl hydrolase